MITVNEWSDEARQAAAEARKNKSGGRLKSLAKTAKGVTGFGLGGGASSTPQPVKKGSTFGKVLKVAGIAAGGLVGAHLGGKLIRTLQQRGVAKGLSRMQKGSYDQLRGMGFGHEQSLKQTLQDQDSISRMLRNRPK